MTSSLRGKATIRPADVVGLSFSALWQQKVRTILTITGVVIGTFALVLSLAVGRGIDHAIVSLFDEDARLRKISVNAWFDTRVAEVPVSERTPKGAMSDAKHKRISKALIRHWARTHVIQGRKQLDSSALKLLARSSTSNGSSRSSGGSMERRAWTERTRKPWRSLSRWEARSCESGFWLGASLRPKTAMSQSSTSTCSTAWDSQAMTRQRKPWGKPFVSSTSQARVRKSTWLDS